MHGQSSGCVRYDRCTTRYKAFNGYKCKFDCRGKTKNRNGNIAATKCRADGKIIGRFRNLKGRTMCAARKRRERREEPEEDMRRQDWQAQRKM
jgi:hypothetical protein